jgi:hypothetical protein
MCYTACLSSRISRTASRNSVGLQLVGRTHLTSRNPSNLWHSLLNCKARELSSVTKRRTSPIIPSQAPIENIRRRDFCWDPAVARERCLAVRRRSAWLQRAGPVREAARETAAPHRSQRHMGCCSILRAARGKGGMWESRRLE